MLHIPLHEFGHNFHGTTHIGPIISGKSPFLDRFFHHGMELTEVAMMARIAENPEEFALAGESKAKYLEYHRREVKKRSETGSSLSRMGEGGQGAGGFSRGLLRRRRDDLL